MKPERIIWGGGINRSLDPRHIQNHEQYDAYDVEVIERGTLSKRKGFGRWRETGNTFSGTVRGVALMYDSDENRYLFVFYDASGDTDLWIEKAGGTPMIIENFFPTSGKRVRSVVFGDRIYFVNGVDRPRWYKEYDGSNHIWGIAGVPSPARRAEDESSFDYFISRALYVDCITSSQDLGIDPPSIWRYRQTVGYYGKESDEQVEESNAGPASKMFHCQFNTAEALGIILEGYVKKGIPIGIADFDDLILDKNESPDGLDYEDEIRWMRMYRQWKMFSDELYSPFEFLVEMKKGWPTSISDVYNRDSAVVAPTTRVQIPVAHHIERVNNRLFLGRIEKELFTQPGLPKDFRGFATAYKSNFSYRMPVTVQNTNSKTLTGAVIPLRFQDSSASNHVATPPSGGGAWTGAYIDTSLTLIGTTTGWYQMMFVDNDGVTPLGFTLISKGANVVTFLVEIPEIAAGGSRTIYLYFEDSQLGVGGNPESYPGEPGDWESLAHYPLLSSDHLLLIDFENWDTGMAMTDITQKRSLAYIEQGPAALGTGVANISKSVRKRFFNRGSSADMEWSPHLNVAGHVTPGLVDCVQLKFYPPSDSIDVLSFTFLVSLSGSTGHSGTVRLADPTDAENEISILVEFADGTANTFDIIATAYDTDGVGYSTLAINVDNQERYYIAVVVTLNDVTLYVVQGDQNGHPAESSSWDTSGFVLESESTSFSGPLKMFSSAEAFIATGGTTTSENRFGEIHVLTREIDGLSELIHFWMWDTYFPDFGLATAGDRESQTGEKHPDRMYFSQLNQPNSVNATDFRDMGELGRPIQGIKGIHNRLFVFDENKVKALFSAGSEQALALASGDTKMWNLSQDLTGDIGGLGVLAPDSLVTMEFAGRDGVGFLSRRGFYFFDGNGFVHISEKVDNLIYDEDVSDDYRRNLTAHFLGRKRQLILSVLGWDTPADYEYWSLIVNMKFAHDVKNMVWTRSSNLIKYGVELDFGIDTGQFVYVYPFINYQILALEKNSDPDTYTDILDDGIGGETKVPVTALAMSKQFDVFDAELLKCDLHTSGDSGYEVDLTVFKDSLISGTPTISNITSGMYRFPIGTNATRFLFKLRDNTAFRCVFEHLDFYFNVHRERRLS